MRDAVDVLYGVGGVVGALEALGVARFRSEDLLAADRCG